MKRIRILAVIGIASSAFALGACQAADTTQGANAADIDTHAEVDVATSRVIFPSTPFRITEEERYIIDTAHNVAVNKCAQEELGINAQYSGFTSLQSDVYEMFNEYGPWTEDMASRFGYVDPQTEADMIANGIEGAPADAKLTNWGDMPELSDVDFERVNKECRSKPEVKQFSLVQLENSQPVAMSKITVADIEEKIKNDERGQAVFSDLKECYTKNNIAFEEIADSAAPSLVRVTASNPDAINEEQIQLALKDVACKNKVNMIPRLADIWAEYEAPVIQENAIELQAYREKIDDLIAKANVYINENSQYLYLPQ